MQVLTTPEAMLAWSQARHAEGQRVGLVPTMGFLHAGHASLMDALRPQCEALVVSLFVNPLQFGAGEDLDRYPRDEAGDLTLCEAHGVDAVFLPSVAAMYPTGFSTRVAVSRLTEHLCGASRPGHFEGVTTVCARLFGLTRCDVAIFGEKDFQQLTVLRKMVNDLAMPVQVLPGALVRAEDGLALSSRNKYLSAEDRRRALSLSAALRAMREAAVAGEREVSRLVSLGLGVLDADLVDYLEIVDPDDLQPLMVLDRPARAVLAATVGRTRLLDNLALVPA